MFNLVDPVRDWRLNTDSSRSRKNISSGPPTLYPRPVSILDCAFPKLSLNTQVSIQRPTLTSDTLIKLGSESESDRTLAKKSRLEKSKALKKTAEQGVGTDGSRTFGSFAINDNRTQIIQSTAFKKRDNRLQSTPRYTVSDLLVKHAARASSSTSGNHRGGEQRPTSTEAVGRSSELVRPSDNESDNDHADGESDSVTVSLRCFFFLMF